MRRLYSMIRQSGERFAEKDPCGSKPAEQDRFI
jgi:hypothetical protein